MKRIAYAAPDGSVAIVIPSIGARLCSSVRAADGISRKPYSPPVSFDRIAKGMSFAQATVIYDPEWSETEDQFVERVRQKDVPSDAKTVILVEEEDLPPRMDPKTKHLRNAWRISGRKVVVDMPAAREIHMNRIRQSRDRHLDSLDREHTKALGRKRQADADAIEAQRETLRNIPQTFDLTKAKTPEALADLWPAGLDPITD